MGSSPIRFGTDGWRAVIADGFTFERVAQVAQASAEVLSQTYAGTGIIIGYDYRFLSEQFAQRAAEAASALGIPVMLSSVAAPTPAFSWAAKQQGTHGALVITASHNPPQYSGIKVKGGFGGSVFSEVTQSIETALSQRTYQTPTQADQERIQLFDPWPSYCQQLSQKVNLEKLKQSPAKVWIDAMHGSAAGGMTRLLGDRVQELRAQRDPLFGGAAPEPLPPQLASSMGLIAADPAPLKVGIVFDGDGDRIAAIDGQGKFLSPQILIPILLEHLSQRRGLQGELVKTVSGSQLFAKVARLYHLPVTETAVGFKYIAERMLKADVLLGGEESGGIGYPNHMPERDAMLSALYLLEAVADTQKDLSDLYRALQEKTDFVSVYDRVDLPVADQNRQAQLLQNLTENPPQSILGQEVIEHTQKDGHKFLLTDESWLMVRGSGTEPLLRLYCEARDPEQVKAILHWAQDWATA
jgi:phosphomannomutase